MTEQNYGSKGLAGLGGQRTRWRKKQLAKMVFEVKPRNVTGFTNGVERMPEYHKGILPLLRSWPPEKATKRSHAIDHKKQCPA